MLLAFSELYSQLSRTWLFPLAPSAGNTSPCVVIAAVQLVKIKLLSEVVWWDICRRDICWISSLTSVLKPFKLPRCIKASFHIPENRLNFPTTRGFRTKISMKLVYQHIAIFLNFLTTLNHLHPLQVENCDSNSRLVVDEDDNGKFRLERVILAQLSANIHSKCCLVLVSVKQFSNELVTIFHSIRYSIQ